LHDTTLNRVQVRTGATTLFLRSYRKWQSVSSLEGKSVHYPPPNPPISLKVTKGKDPKARYIPSQERKRTKPPCPVTSCRSRTSTSNVRKELHLTSSSSFNPPHPSSIPTLATHLRTLATIRTALASLLTHKTTTQRRKTRRQTPAILLLLRRGRLLVLLSLGLSVVHLLLGRGCAILHGGTLCVLGLGWAVAVRSD
jgi:hypothetical protein